MISPLEQFDIVVFFELFCLEVTNSGIGLFFLIIFVFIVYCSIKYLRFIPGGWFFFVEFFIKVFFRLVFSLVGGRGLVFFPFLFSLFVFVVLCNFMGLLPYGFTVTSHIIVTFLFSGIVLLSCIYGGVLVHGVRFFKLFVSEEVPLFLFWIFILLELLSYCVRVFSLAIRLSANMLAGHVLLHLIASFFVFIFRDGIFFFVIVFILLLAVLFLELVVAILQAYIFVVLSALYISEMLYLH